MVNMILLRLQQRLISFSRSIVLHTCFEGEQEGPYVVEAVQLVEDGDVVDLAYGLFVGRLAGWERVGCWVGDEHEAVAGRREVVAPGFVCFLGGRRGEDGFFEGGEFCWD